MASLRDYFYQDFLAEWHRAYWLLVRVLVPALIIVRLMDVFGFTAVLAELLQTVMAPLGLPGEFALVWAAALLTNIYTALAVYFELAAGQPFSVTQVTVLGLLLLVGHALPVEGAVAKMMGVPWWLTLLLRVGGAYLLAWLVGMSMHAAGHEGQVTPSMWQGAGHADDLWSWCRDTGVMLGVVYLVLGSLIAVLRVLRFVGIEAWLQSLLRPLTAVLQVHRDAAQITLIGLLLGLSFGAGLLLSEAQQGRIASRDQAVVVCFLGLCHSVIEDTLLIMLLGAELWAILGVRLVFALVIGALLARTLYRQPAPKLA